MPNQKISGFDDLSAAGITLSDVVGVAAYYDNGGTLTNVRFSGNDIINTVGGLPGVLAVNDTATAGQEIKILDFAGFNPITFKATGIESSPLTQMNITGKGNLYVETTSSNTGIFIQTQSNATGTGGILISNRQTNGELELDTDGELKITLPSAPSVGDVLSAKDVNGNVEWVTPSTGGASAFTTLTAADVIDWDYATDGPNIKVTLGAGLENVLTVNTIGEFPDGSEGWVILDPSASVDYRLPDEDEGSAATMQSVITNGDVSLGGTNPVLFHYTYDGSTFYWTKFENMIAPANYPPSIDYDGSDLLIYVTPEAFNQATQGQIAGSAVFDNLIQPSTFGDMRGPISPGSGFEFYPRDNATYGAAFWSMGTGTVGIFRDTDLSLVNSLSNNISWQGYIQGPYSSGAFETLVDFDGATNTGSYNQHLYLSSKRFRVYNPSTFYNFPELEDYSGDGGANLEDEWLFVSFSITAGATGTATLRVACQSSLDAAVAAGGATAWNYNGTGASSGLGPLTVNVDANGIYEEVVTDNFDEADIVNILIGVNNIGGEYGNFHYGLFGVYNKDINLADTTQNWIDTREIYGIT